MSFFKNRMREQGAEALAPVAVALYAQVGSGPGLRRGRPSHGRLASAAGVGGHVGATGLFASATSHFWNAYAAAMQAAEADVRAAEDLEQSRSKK